MCIVTFWCALHTSFFTVYHMKYIKLKQSGPQHLLRLFLLMKVEHLAVDFTLLFVVHEINNKAKKYSPCVFIFKSCPS